MNQSAKTTYFVNDILFISSWQLNWNYSRHDTIGEWLEKSSDPHQIQMLYSLKIFIFTLKSPQFHNFFHASYWIKTLKQQNSWKVLPSSLHENQVVHIFLIPSSLHENRALKAWRNTIHCADSAELRSLIWTIFFPPTASIIVWLVITYVVFKNGNNSKNSFRTRISSQGKDILVESRPCEDQAMSWVSDQQVPRWGKQQSVASNHHQQRQIGRFARRWYSHFPNYQQPRGLHKGVANGSNTDPAPGIVALEAMDVVILSWVKATSWRTIGGAKT